MYDVNPIHDPIGAMTERAKWEAEQQARAQHGYSLGKGMPGTPVTPPLGRQPIAARIEDLSNQIAIAGHQVTETRQAYEIAARARNQAESRFADLANALVSAIHEHLEGTPENVPYQP